MRDILHTVGTRYLIAIINLALIFINAKIFGVDGVGTIGLVLAAIGLSTVTCSLFSGNTIIYFMNRYPIRRLLLPVYGWIPIGAGLACGVMALFSIFPIYFLNDVFLLSVLNAAITANTRFLLGKNRVGAFNLTYMLQGGLLFFVLLFFYFVLQQQTPMAYITALYLTYGIAFAISSFLLLRQLQKTAAKTASYHSLWALIQEMFIYGLWGSADNIAENLTIRLNYFLIKSFGGLASVGLLDAGTKISESVWHINRSIGLIEYNRIAQTNDKQLQKNITLRYLKAAVIAAALASSCILLIPEWIYTEVLFSAEFNGIKKVIYGLSPGIVSMAGHSIISQFFIGSGHIRYSTFASFVGLLVLLPCGLLLIPTLGVLDRKSTCLNSSHEIPTRMPSSA